MASGVLPRQPPVAMGPIFIMGNNTQKLWLG